MKYHQAKKQFKHALKHQQTISIPKLNKSNAINEYEPRIDGKQGNTLFKE